jgi:transcriptional regulator with XRE-family HTH domain
MSDLTPSRCRDLRAERDWTPDDLSAAVGTFTYGGDAFTLPASSIDAYESGKSQLADVTVAAVAVALGIPADDEDRDG